MKPLHRLAIATTHGIATQTSFTIDTLLVPALGDYTAHAVLSDAPCTLKRYCRIRIYITRMSARGFLRETTACNGTRLEMARRRRRFRGPGRTPKSGHRRMKPLQHLNATVAGGQAVRIRGALMTWLVFQHPLLHPVSALGEKCTIGQASTGIHESGGGRKQMLEAGSSRKTSTRKTCAIVSTRSTSCGHGGKFK